MKRLLGYIGILRLYSLADLILLLLAIRPTVVESLGILSLWVGFLLLLESFHKHEYREKVSPVIAWLFFVMGLFLYKHIEGGIFIVLSYIYSLKKQPAFGGLAPLIRGGQNFLLVAGITGYMNPLPWIAWIAIIVRNFLGDLRDVEKDKEEGMRTLPVVLGVQSSWSSIHLLGLLLTSFTWWYVGKFNFLYLVIAWVIEIVTYRLTPRISKKQ